MKKRCKNWKRWFLIPLLCLLLVLAGGCGGSGAANGGKKEAEQELQRVEAAADNPAEGGFDEQEESLADENSDSYDPASDYGGGDAGGSGEDPSENEDAGHEEQDSGSVQIDINGVYTTKEDVALYIHTYGRLPNNFMTKKEARQAGWSGGSLEDYVPGMCIGGDRFGNYEGILPEGRYHECDINTLGARRRGAERIIYADDGRIYYTNDHYETFTLLYGSE